MKYYDIVIIDSGVDVNHSALKTEKSKPIEGFSISVLNGKLDINDNFNDVFGHGTAVYSIISTKAKDASILNIKIDSMNFENELPLILCLEFIRENIRCKIINISMGICECFLIMTAMFLFLLLLIV